MSRLASLKRPHRLRHKEFLVLLSPLTPSSLAPDALVPGNDGSNGSGGIKRHRRSITNETEAPLAPSCSFVTFVVKAFGSAAGNSSLLNPFPKNPFGLYTSAREA